MVSRFYLLCAVAWALSAQSPSANPPLLPAANPPDTAGIQAKPTDPVKTPVTPELRGDILMAKKMYREAIDMYRELPPSAVRENKIGIAYHQMLDFESARKAYERAVRLNPKYPEAVNNLGTIYYARKNFRRAISQYKRALRFAPSSASMYSNLGTAYFARKEYKLAFDNYQKALSIDPEVFEHRGTNGVLLQERSVTERAKFHYYMAKTYAKAGQTERALLYIRKALEEGFKEANKFKEEPEFAALRDLPEFQQLMASEPRVL